MINPPLGTPEQEAALCRKAFEGIKPGAWAWHLHHETLIEQLEFSIEARIAYILDNKSVSEQALRLRLLRPMRGTSAKWPAAYAKWQAVYAKWQAADAKCKAASAKRHAEQCPGCPWDGKTIFPEDKP